MSEVTISDQLRRASWMERGYHPILASDDIPASLPLLLSQSAEYIAALERELFLFKLDALFARLRSIPNGN